MQQSSLLSLQVVSFGFQSPLFQGLSFSMCSEKVGLVGKNGVGKSTLLRLIAGELRPSEGQVTCFGTHFYLGQERIEYRDHTVAQALGIDGKLRALARIEAGSVCEEDFAALSDDWSVASRYQALLSKMGLAQVALSRPMTSLSGGEERRVLLAKAFSGDYDLVLLDEPTNNLDASSREALYQALLAYQGALLVVSHDRTLLGLMDRIAEITPLGLTCYGGDYSCYVEQKNLQDASIQQQLQAQLQNLQTAKKQVQKRQLQHGRGVRKGVSEKYAQIRAKGCYDKMAMKGSKQRSENTQKRLKTQQDRKLSELSEKMAEVKKRIVIEDPFIIKMSQPLLPRGKRVLDMEAVEFAYPNGRSVLS